MVAAKGVDFFEPLNPAFPELDQVTTSPLLSAIVTMVLLKLALICTTPSDSTTRFPRRPFDTAFFTPAALVDKLFSLGRGWIERVRPIPPRYFFGAFFLPAIALRLPLCVRAFVLVRCPRTGRPRR